MPESGAIVVVKMLVFDPQRNAMSTPQGYGAFGKPSFIMRRALPRSSDIS
jgi:hypothetical protein